MSPAFDPKDARSVAEIAGAEVERATARMREISDQLRQTQPARDGMVSLHLANCGRRCLGCPHLHWRVWRVHPNRVVHRFSPHAIKSSPLRYLRASGEFAEGAAETRELVEEALDLAAYRSRIVKHLSALGRILNW